MRRLNLATDRTMHTVQQLCKGIDVGWSAIGLVTYMRTDNINLADEALTEIRYHIKNKIGKGYLPGSVKQYKTEPKNAQEAHKAIRPAPVYRAPEGAKSFLSTDQLKPHQVI